MSGGGAGGMGRGRGGGGVGVGREGGAGGVCLLSGRLGFLCVVCNFCFCFVLLWKGVVLVRGLDWGRGGCLVVLVVWSPLWRWLWWCRVCWVWLSGSLVSFPWAVGGVVVSRWLMCVVCVGL